MKKEKQNENVKKSITMFENLKSTRRTCELSSYIQ